MKTLIVVLIIVCLLQAAVIPLELVLIVLICRSYIRAEKQNLYLSFGFGLLLSHLNSTVLGFQSIIYLILIAFAGSLAKSRLTANPLLIIPLSFILVSLNEIFISLFTHQSFQLFPKVFIEASISLPILFIVRLWEERFVARRDIKLKM
jgi:rod shape-determining protein MreD